VHVFDPTRKYLRVSTLENHSSSITAVRFSRDGNQLLSCGGDRALVLSAVDGKKVRSVSGCLAVVV
jgi:WD40 repeat protein